MLASFISWWLARMSELLPRSWVERAGAPRDGIVVDADSIHNEKALVRRGLHQEAVSLSVAVRRRGKQPVIFRAPAEAVLVTRHSVPVAARRELTQLLHHELARITPFPPDQLFWRWDVAPEPASASRITVILTMVPRRVLASVMAALDERGLKADFVEVGAADRPLLLPVGDVANRPAGAALVRGLAWACGCLAVIALGLPMVLQAVALHAANTAIDQLRPTIGKVEAIRRGITAGDAGRDLLEQDSERTGDVLHIIAAITGILPDDTYLTDFSLRERQLTLSGRSASAPRLITGLSADTAIKNTAFAAPVTRIEGATLDAFSIKAEVAR